jgi:methionyl-tRNA synthetase
MAHRYRGGIVTKTGGDSPLATQAADLAKQYENAMSKFEVHAAISGLIEFSTTCNTYIEMMAPWKLAKESERSDTLDHVLFVLAESLRIIAVLFSPVLPAAAGEIFYQLNLREEPEMRDAGWGILPDKHHLGKPVPLFPRIETSG